ncbi:PREDICTED: AP-3 complex subunit sigma-like isoform X2 [Ipomoea nil]|uniref:AP-3 complex subunit sigma-like isoform X2 n=1 Tax=Ipomoea nil TaxID=35883 RepID=UPI00090187B1|nr:PREDICTED: AP-3 complex subunit sigma-like isoform X2 [Ipomoea nil]
MMRAVMMMNDKGKPRLVKFYEHQPMEKQQELIRKIYGVLCSRPENVSNFVKVDSLFGSDARLVYKTYATLHVIFIFDGSENELAMLDLMQDEIVMGGQVLETSSFEVVKAVEDISKLEKGSNSIMLVPSIPGWQGR